MNGEQRAGSGGIKPLNAPTPVEVRTDDAGMPVAVRIEAPIAKRGAVRPARYRQGRAEAVRPGLRSDGVWLGVACVEDVWKINDEWWRGPEFEIERVYFSLLLENDQRVTVFHDLVAGRWRRQAD